MNVLLSIFIIFCIESNIHSITYCLLSVGIQSVVSSECKSVTSSDFFLDQEISFYSQVSISVLIWLELDQMMVVGAEKPWISGREFMAAVLPPHI